MARQATPIEFNKFIGGLATDASPLTSVPNTSLEEDNFILNIDGSRQRRLGFDYESGYEKQSTTISGVSGDDVATASYKWRNAGGDPEQSIAVIQIGNEIKFYDLSSVPISPNLLYTSVITDAATGQNFSYTVVDGILIVATGQKDIITYTFTAPSTITESTITLYVRDTFGVEDVVDGVDLMDTNFVQNRPTTGTEAHVYNLRNQSWGVPRILGNTEVTGDLKDYFYAERAPNQYPSNADTVNQALYADTSDTDNRTIERFFVIDLLDNPIGTTRAPQGYYIIDALNRGTSRMEANAYNYARYPTLSDDNLTALPQDVTPGGASVVAEFAGRVFYSGFSGDVIDGDKLSPRMSSYVLFSKNVESFNDIGRCYQVGDPTSKETPDLLDTDGGFVRLNGAFNIKALVNVGSSLMVLAQNGVWRILGGNDSGFSGTNQLVEKVSDHGISSSDSVVVVDNSLMFWGLDGIYHAHTDQFGSWVVENISFGRIQRVFDAIPLVDRLNARGSYDTFDRKVRWLYYNRTTDTTPTKELVLDITLKAFYTNTVKQIGDGLPRVVCYLITEPYTLTLNSGSISREAAYVVVSAVSPTIEYTFATCSNLSFLDWYSEDGIGVDADAYMVTGYVSGEDFQRNKTIPYLHVHLNRTEDGFEEDGGGNLTPTNQSSCWVQVRWEWSDSANSGRWGTPFQAYRYKRMYMPAGPTDPFDIGFSTIVTRNKIRGSGKVASIKFYTEEGKDCHLYGWSMIFSSATNV